MSRDFKDNPSLRARGDRLFRKVLGRGHGRERQEGNDSKMQGARLISISDLNFSIEKPATGTSDFDHLQGSHDTVSH